MKQGNTYIWKIFAVYILIIVLMLICGRASGQTVITDKTFKKTQSGISIVEFWAEWNKHNECSWITNVENANPFRMDIQTSTAKDHDIKVLPTIIVFNNGKEVGRFEGNIKFELCPKRTPKQVQKIVDELLIDKF